jgi:hypothetical protein
MRIDPASVHRLKNQLAIIMGFCELLLGDMADDDPRRRDVMHIQTAGRSALDELPPIAPEAFDTTLNRRTDGHDVG